MVVQLIGFESTGTWMHRLRDGEMSSLIVFGMVSTIHSCGMHCSALLVSSHLVSKSSRAADSNRVVALAQIMARIQLTSTGDRLITLKSRTRVCSYIWFALALLALHAVYVFYFIGFEPQADAVLIATLPLVGLDLGVFAYFVYMVATARRLVREEYDIPELRCKGNEDCCLAVFCTCCVVAQMGRHTADYEVYRAYCLTDTGLANHIEVKLPSEYMDETTTIDL